MSFSESRNLNRRDSQDISVKMKLAEETQESRSLLKWLRAAEEGDRLPRKRFLAVRGGYLRMDFGITRFRKGREGGEGLNKTKNESELWQWQRKESGV